MASIPQTDSELTLNSFCKSGTFLRAKIALLSFYNIHYSEWAEKLILMLEYLQLMSLCLFLHVPIYDTNSDDSYFSEVILYFFKLINPSYLMPLQVYSPIVSTLMWIVFCCMLSKYFVFAFITCIAYWGWNGNNLIVNVWQWIFKLQCRVLCFFLTSFWTQIILCCSAGTFSIEGVNKGVIIGLCCALVIAEYLFSFFLETQLSYVLPTKNFLASKCNRLQAGTLTQKFVLQVLQIVLSSQYRASVWIFSFLNLTYITIRSYKFYEEFPLYNLKALLYQGILLSIVVSLNVTCFVHTVANSSGYKDAHATFLLVIWIISSLLIGKISYESLRKRVISLFIGLPKGIPKFLVHKITATKQLRSVETLSHKTADTLDISYLFTVTGNTKIKDIFDLNAESFPEIADGITEKKDIDKISLHYLINLSAKFPRNKFIKLYLAYFCSKDPEFYVKSLTVATDLLRTKWSQGYLSTALLLYNIEKKIKFLNNNNDSNLNLLSYMKNHIAVEDLRQKILHHTDLKLTICDNILGEKANIGLIFNYAQQINQLKGVIQQKIGMLSASIPDYYCEPSLLYTGYYLVLADSPENYQKHIKTYDQKLARYEGVFTSPNLTAENLYQDTNIFLILSGEKNTCGQIVFYCSSSLQKLCGGKLEAYKGSYFSALFTPSFQSFFHDLLKQTMEGGKDSILNKKERVFLQHKEGHIIEAEIYIKIHPYISKGLYLDLIIRPVFSGKEYFLINEEGNIEGATKTISNSLCIDISSHPNSTLPEVKMLSEELLKVNEAFKIVTKVQSKEQIGHLEDTLRDKTHSDDNHLANFPGYKKALKLFRSYSSGARRVKLTSLQRNKNKEESISYQYDFDISLIHCGPATLTLVAFEKISDFEENEHFFGQFLDAKVQEELALDYNKNVGIVNTNKENNKDISGSENIEDCDENINDGELFVTEYRTEHNLNTCGNLLISPTNRSLLPKTLDKLEPIVPIVKPQQLLNKQGEIAAREYEPKMKDRLLEFMSSTQPRQLSSSRTSNRAFRSALEINFHPKSFRPTCLMFYAVILVTFLSQIILKVVSDSTMEALSVKKSLLYYSHLRTFEILLIEINARGSLNQIVDTTHDNGQSFSGWTAMVGSVKGHAAHMKDYNQQIINMTYHLDQDLNNHLFAKDVRIYGSYINSNDPSYRYVTNFEVIDEMIDTAYELASVSDLNSTAGLHIFNFTVVNILGDFLYKSQDISNLLSDSVETERGYFQTTIALCLVITPLLLAGIILMLAIITWRQYVIEINNMLAFIRLNPKSVKQISKELKTFKKNIESKDYSEYKKYLETLDNVTIFNQQDDQETNYHKKHNSQVIEYSKTRYRYFGYVVKASLYIIILMGLMIFNYVSAQNSAKVIYRRQNQLEFANSLSEIVSVSYCAFLQTFLSNNTTPVKKSTPLQVFTDGITELATLQSQVPKEFLDEDHTYDPTVENMLFHYNKCDEYNFDSAVDIYYCKLLLSRGYYINLVSVMAAYQSMIQGKLDDWNNCNKSSMAALFDCVYLNVDDFFPSYLLIALEAQLIGDVISNNLDNNISDANHQRNLFVIVFSICLTIVSLLIWFQVLTKLRDAHNDFKKVLQIFPPTLILSSFLLRNFVMRHSKGLQDRDHN